MTPRPPVVILCGGRGTRLRAHSSEVPKPLVEIGGRPIVWHVIRLYAAQGFDRFVLAAGYRGELIERFAEREPWPDGVEVRVLDTGADTETGGRVAAAARHLASEERLCVTYSDGLADVDLAELLRFHHAHGGPATVTVVRPRLQFGVALLDGEDRVLAFEEKPRSEHWINGGFFCFERPFLDRLAPDSVLEREPLAGLASAGELRAFRHHGFWQCMDTLKDALSLNEQWDSGRAPWRLWDAAAEDAPAGGVGASRPPLVAS
ncbi:MAG TPA: sugar phosphate nucleotidyltransferase [Solirubrobacteraceae bacterium]|nr:sugar phosphate nucleotidyltransferase [Solirubrobacteraceae bacterium]